MTERKQMNPAGLGGPPPRAPKPDLPPPPPRQVPEQAVATAPPAREPSVDSGPGSELRRPKRVSARRAQPGSSESSVQVNLSLPVAHIEWIHSQQRSGTTRGNIVLEVIAEQVDRLPALVAQLNKKSQTAGGLFVLSDERNVAVQTAPMQIRVHRSSLQTLEDLAAKSKAPSRSHLVRAAINGHLNTTT